jgi:antitoxin (DNA-binding transcriptional repressor) of toxin-antitoxin stability system
MKVEHISVTDAARNFADCINRARYQGTTFILHKGGKAVATIEPIVEKKPGNGREIAAALAKVRLTPAESKAWKVDLEAGRKFLLRAKSR